MVEANPNSMGAAVANDAASVLSSMEAALASSQANPLGQSGSQFNAPLFNNTGIIGGTNLHMLEQTNTWHQIESSSQNEVHPPCPRSLHASVALNNNFYIFGGYDGTNRRNDFYSFNFSTNTWSELNPNGSASPPSPRDRHTAVVHARQIYIFGGYDGYNRVDDFHKYCI